MTTKLKAKRFRIGRRGTAQKGRSDAAVGSGADEPDSQADVADTETNQPVADDVPTTSTEDAIEAIRQEGLTGRQLRMARRVAQRHNLKATSDFDAVRLLRQRGIDPFKRSNMLELVVPQGGAEPHEGGAPDAFADQSATNGSPKPRIQLPQTVSEDAGLPSAELSPAEQRNKEISEIQRDIARRRRRKLALLMARLAFFVFLPTAIVGYYFYKVATPMYSSKSEFLILQADNAGGSGLGGLLSGTQFATSQDSIAVQSYLQSKDAMLRLNKDHGFKSHFTQLWIDPIQRLTENPSNEDAYKTYRKHVKIGYDPTEGVIRMEVTAPDPNLSAEFNNSLISYAEDRVNGLSHQKRGDQMKDAMQGFEDAQNERRKAQEALVQLQQKGAILDPEGVIAGLRSQINNVELQVQEKQLQLAALLDNARPNQAKVDGARGDVRRLQDLLDGLDARMTEPDKSGLSLVQQSTEIELSRADLATADAFLQSALQGEKQSALEAGRQVRYLTVPVRPIASDAPSYPRKFENTILAFLIFSGIYLMVSLTSSILREQVSN